MQISKDVAGVKGDGNDAKSGGILFFAVEFECKDHITNFNFSRITGHQLRYRKIYAYVPHCLTDKTEQHRLECC